MVSPALTPVSCYVVPARTRADRSPRSLLRSRPCHLAPAPLVLGRAARVARPHRRAQGGPVPRHDPPRVHLHRPGGPRRHRGRHLPPRDVRRHDRPRLDADVPPQPQDQGHGRQDGPVRRGFGRDLRWCVSPTTVASARARPGLTDLRSASLPSARLPLLPRRPGRQVVPPGARQARQEPQHRRLPSCQQVRPLCARTCRRGRALT